MIKFNFIFVLIIMGLIISLTNSACKSKQSDEITASNVNEIAAMLNEFLNDTNYFKPGQDTANVRMLIDGYKEYHDYNKYMSNLVNKRIETSPITYTKARKFHTEYIKLRGVPTTLRPTSLPAGNPLRNDATLSVVFDFPEILAAMNATFQPSSWTDPEIWMNKGFLIYLINYGSTGSDGAGKDAYRTSTVVQLANKVNDEWVPTSPYNAFDFGDLKPPKIVSGITIVEEQL